MTTAFQCEQTLDFYNFDPVHAHSLHSPFGCIHYFSPLLMSFYLNNGHAVDI